ncbi:MAG: hypothetical protein U0X91_20655 [Spirosomataceae bacterium]
MKRIPALMLCLWILCKLSSTGFSQSKDSLLHITPAQARAAMKAKADASFYARQSAYKDTLIAQKDSTVTAQKKKIVLKNAELWSLRIALLLVVIKLKPVR